MGAMMRFLIRQRRTDPECKSEERAQQWTPIKTAMHFTMTAEYKHKVKRKNALRKLADNAQADHDDKPSAWFEQRGHPYHTHCESFSALADTEHGANGRAKS